MIPLKGTTFAIACVFALVQGPESRAAQGRFTYFRSDAGLQTGTGALPDNLEAPEALRWRVAMDPGHSTPILCKGRIFLTAYRAEAKELSIQAVSESTGQPVWRASVVPEQVEQTHPIGSPATATPASDGERLFVFFGSAGLFCYDLDGKKLWEQRMGPFHDEYGAGSSPVLCDDKIILNQDHDTDSFLAAFDQKTGHLLWKIPRPDAVRSYSTPALWVHAGKPELLVAGALQLSAYSPENGERLWWVNGLARIVIPTPASSGDTVYMASWAPGGDSSKRLELAPWANALKKWDANHDGKLSKSEIDDHEVLDRFFRMDLDQDGQLNQNEWERHAAVFHRAQNALLAIKPAGVGELKPESVVWTHRRGVPYVASPVVDHGIVWMVKEGGIVTKLDAFTGELLQEERVPGFGNYFSSPVAGDGKVYFSSEPGTVSVLAATREWRVDSSRNFHEKIYATPVLDHGRLFLRTEGALYCFQGGRP